MEYIVIDCIIKVDLQRQTIQNSAFKSLGECISLPISLSDLELPMNLAMEL